MAYIGRGTDKLSNIEKLDTITFDGSSSYTLQKNSVNFTPSSANNLQVSIDGVVQAGNFTVSGSTIDFGVAIPATSTNDFIFHYGTGLVTTVADGAITTAKLGDSSVSLAKLSATGTKNATTFLRGDNTFSALPVSGITEADMWRLTANKTQSYNTSQDITANWERVDTNAFGKIGTGMTESSGIFSFPSTGLYSIEFRINTYTLVGGSNYAGSKILVTTNNSTYNVATEDYTSFHASNAQGTVASFVFVNVTNTSNIKVKFQFRTGSADHDLEGNTNINRTYVKFIRLGDSV